MKETQYIYTIKIIHRVQHSGP